MQAAPQRLSEGTIRLLKDPAHELFLASASAWEIAIKYALDRLPLPVPPQECVPSRMARSGTRGLSIEHRHALNVATSPYYHRDPFDRLLIAQTQLENATLITADRQLELYDVNKLMA